MPLFILVCKYTDLELTDQSIGGKIGASVYLDLAYLPSGHAASTVDVEFFCRLRSSCYIISGDDSYKEGLMRSILDALLEGKSVWPEDVPVSTQFYIHLLIKLHMNKA